MNNAIKILFFSILITSCNYSFFIPKNQLIKEINGYVFKLNNEIFILTSNDTTFKLDSSGSFEILHLDFEFSKINRNIIENMKDTLYLNEIIQIQNSPYLITSYLKIRYYNENKFELPNLNSFGFQSNLEVLSVTGEILSFTQLINKDFQK